MERSGIRGGRAGSSPQGRPAGAGSEINERQYVILPAFVIITISRMFGSGGSDVAARVSRVFGWQLLDNSLVDEVADRLGISRSEVSSLEERVPSLAERIASSLAMSAPELAVPMDDAPMMETAETRVVNVTKRVMDEAIQSGNAELGGRGSQSLLAEPQDALHEFCYSPKA